jgi:predicted nucleic-acid-binding protein
MLAVDTNIVVRYLIDDNPAQSARLRQLIGSQPVFLATTVLLETEWILRRFYKCKPADVAMAFRLISGLAGVALEEPREVHQALTWLEAGMDFADALHLSKAGRCAAFLTFDKDFIRAGKKVTDMTVKAP